MQLYREINSSLPKVGAITLGSFDTLHLGHKYLFDKMQKYAQKSRLVITFTPHPKTFFQKPHFKPLLAIEEKLYYLEKMGIENVLLLNFSEKFSKIPYQKFLEDVHKRTQFTHLVLGKGAAFGHNREGTQENVELLSPSLGFNAHYLSPYSLNSNELLSSTAVRRAVATANFEKAERLLGREYLFYIHAPHKMQWQEKTSSFLYPTKRQLPKPGSYRVSLLQENISPLSAIAKLTEESVQLSMEKKPQLSDTPLFVSYLPNNEIKTSYVK